MARKSRAYKFDDRNYSGQSVLATVSSAVSVIIFLALALVCTATHGGAGSWAGPFGFTGGTLLGGLMVAVWFIVFCIGLAQ